MDLCSVSRIREMLADNGLSPRKSLGQNFLINPRIPKMIASRSAELARGAVSDEAPIGVIEIGPGIGALTAELAEVFDRVVAVEIDSGLAGLFRKTFSEYENVILIEGDVLKTDVSSLLDDHFSDILAAGGSVSVCANLPYYITTPAIMKLLESFDLRTDVVKNFDVSPGSFYPPPKVTSTVVSIIPHGGIREIFPDAPVDDPECRKFFEYTSNIIEAAFAQRRKTLTNALSGLYPKESVASALVKIGRSADIRGERLSAVDFCALSFQLNFRKE